jgi:hypothetical protein
MGVSGSLPDLPDSTQGEDAVAFVIAGQPRSRSDEEALHRTIPSGQTHNRPTPQAHRRPQPLFKLPVDSPRLT